jgi:hypothetical protein
MKQKEYNFQKTKPHTKSLKCPSSLNDLPQLDTHISQLVVWPMTYQRRQQWIHTGCRNTGHFSK